jgi:hypothetical protein
MQNKPHARSAAFCTFVHLCAGSSLVHLLAQPTAGLIKIRSYFRAARKEKRRRSAAEEDVRSFADGHAKQQDSYDAMMALVRLLALLIIAPRWTWKELGFAIFIGRAE